MNKEHHATLDNTTHSTVEVTHRELLALNRIGVMGTLSPPTESELEDMRALRALAARIEAGCRT